MRNRKRKKYIGIVVAFLLIVFGVFVVTKLFTLSSILFQVVLNKKIDLKKEDDHINLLLLGRGGPNHDGPNLTDTIIFASVDTKTNKITLVSVPRDLWIPSLQNKINDAYADGEAKKQGGGLIESKAVIGNVVGQNIDYGIVLDFSGFVKAVDMLGGIDVNVDRTFDDYEYPIEGKENDLCGHSLDDVKAFTATDSASLTVDADQLQYFSCRYQHIHFDKGPTHMDGQTALEYVRSRHALGVEGTDFARSQRQEKVIKALKDKVFSLGTLLNPAKVIGLYETIKNSIDTDIPQSQLDDFIRLAQQMKNAKIQSGVIDIGDENRKGLLIHPDITSDYQYEWVLIPALGSQNYSGIKKYITCEINSSNCDTPINPSPRPK